MRFEEILVTATIVSGIVFLVNFINRKDASKKDRKPNWLVKEIVALFPVLVLVLFLRSFLGEGFRIPTGSMKPTLLEGDFILVNKFAYGVRLPISGTTIIPVGKPKVGDIVVFRHTNGQDLIKRVVGVPGDRIRYTNKQLYINDKLIPHTEIATTQDHGIYTIESKERLANIVHDIYDYPQAMQIYKYDNVIVPPHSVFVMGDNRSNSVDSRVWGFLDEKYLIGKAVATWMSWDSSANGKIVPIRWSRIGKSIYQYADKHES